MPPSSDPPPLILAVHRVHGRLSPALYHDARLPRVHDPVVWSMRLDKQPNAAELAAMPLAELFERYKAACELGALPPSEAIPDGRRH